MMNNNMTAVIHMSYHVITFILRSVSGTWSGTIFQIQYYIYVPQQD